MGLDFSHGGASWSYGGFHRFRTKLAKEVGIDDFDSIISTDDKRFLKISEDPIYYLLSHSDCDGIIKSTHLRIVSKRLGDLISKWPEDDYDKKTALKLIEGMNDAHAEGEDLGFT